MLASPGATVDEISKLVTRVADIAEPAVDVLFETSREEASNGVRRHRRQRAQVGLPLEHGGEDVGNRRARERWASRQELVEQAAEGPDVGALVELLPAHLLGAHVRRRTHDDAGVRGVHRHRRRLVRRARGRLDGLRQTEVEDLHHPRFGQHDVGGLEIAMDDALRVRGVERIGDLPRDRERFVDVLSIPLARSSAGHPVRERLPRDQLEHERANALRFFEPVNARDVWMVERRQEPRFAVEPLQALGILRQRFGQDLESDFAAQSRIASFPDLTHPALAERGEHFIGAEAKADMKGHVGKGS